jgi:hypothetical protein
MRVQIVHDSKGTILSAAVPRQIGKGTMELRGAGPEEIISEIDVHEVSDDMQPEVRLGRLRDILLVHRIRLRDGKASLERLTERRQD